MAQFALIALTINLLFLSTGCKKDKGTEQELITKVVVELVSDGPTVKTFSFEAVDGDGDGVFNAIDTIDIPAAQAYSCRILVYDETKTPVVNLSEEIAEESLEHLFVYKPTGANVVVIDLNQDDNGAPLGSESTWVAGSTGTGAIQIALHHEPTNKTASDPGGDIDFQVNFPVILR